MIRHEFGRAASVAIWVAGAVILAANGWPPSASTVGITAGVAGLLWSTCWYPAVVLEHDAVTVRNPLRTVRIPWPTLEEATFGWALRLRAGDVVCTAAAAPGPASMSVLYDRHRTPGGVLERDAVGGSAQRLAPALTTVRQQWAASSPAPAGMARDGTGAPRSSSDVPGQVAVLPALASRVVLAASTVSVVASLTWMLVS